MRYAALALQVGGCLVALSPYQAMSEAWWTTLLGLAVSWVGIVAGYVADAGDR